MALRKPHILIPLPKSSSRGDQILNAESFERQGYSYVLKEEDLSIASLLDAIQTVMNKRNVYVEAMNKSELNNSIDTIIQLIEKSQL